MAQVKLIEVGGTNCGVCKMMKPMVEKTVSMFNPEQLEFLYICGDGDDGERLMEENNIGVVSRVPTFVFKKNGVEVERLDGAISFPALMNKIKNHLS